MAEEPHYDVQVTGGQMPGKQMDFLCGVIDVFDEKGRVWDLHYRDKGTGITVGVAVQGNFDIAVIRAELSVIAGVTNIEINPI